MFPKVTKNYSQHTYFCFYLVDMLLALLVCGGILTPIYYTNNIPPILHVLNSSLQLNKQLKKQKKQQNEKKKKNPTQCAPLLHVSCSLLGECKLWLLLPVTPSSVYFMLRACRKAFGEGSVLLVGALQHTNTKHDSQLWHYSVWSIVVKTSEQLFFPLAAFWIKLLHFSSKYYQSLTS